MHPAWRRAPWWVALAVALLVHWLSIEAIEQAATPLDPQASVLRRLDVVYTREVQLAARAPALQGAAPPRVRPRATAATPMSDTAASAPAPAASAPEQAPEQASRPAEALAQASGPADANPSVPTAPDSAAATETAETAEAPATFSWPVSTRIRYRLLGQYRGDVHGSAEVEWLRDGERYQVHLDVSAALLFNRRMSSEGRVTETGLAPQRYEEVTTNRLQVFSEPRRSLMSFDAAQIQLADGRQVPTLAEVQDTASQFIQFVYWLSTRPELRRPGARIDVALALPRRVGRWVYEVGPLEPVDTPAGPVECWPLRPAAGANPGELQAEVWLAPRLQMLPVRLRIRQSAEVYFDLFIDRLPEQAGR